MLYFPSEPADFSERAVDFLDTLSTAVSTSVTNTFSKRFIEQVCIQIYYILYKPLVLSYSFRERTEVKCFILGSRSKLANGGFCGNSPVSAYSIFMASISRSTIFSSSRPESEERRWKQRLLKSVKSVFRSGSRLLKFVPPTNHMHNVVCQHSDGVLHELSKKTGDGGHQRLQHCLNCNTLLLQTVGQTAVPLQLRLCNRNDREKRDDYRITKSVVRVLVVCSLTSGSQAEIEISPPIFTAWSGCNWIFL